MITNLHSLNPSMLCANFIELGLISGSKQEDENVKCLRKQQRQILNTGKFLSRLLAFRGV